MCFSLVGAIALSAGAANALSVSDFQEVAGGAAINGSGLAVLGSTGIGLNGSGVASGGSIAAPQLVAPISLTSLASGNDIVSGLLNALAGVPPLPFLVSTSLEDATDGAGALTFLFAVNGGTAASAFGSHVLVTLSNPNFSDTTFDTLSNIIPPATESYQVGLRIAEAERVAPQIPLPAGMILIVSGFAVMGVRSARLRR